jgi:malonyl-CoA decarboxylase
MGADPAHSVQRILNDPDRLAAPSDPRNPSPAVHKAASFYSISTAPAAAGMELGAFLIKQVVTYSQQFLPGVSRFFTLSPIPGFAAWLARVVRDTPQRVIDVCPRFELARSTGLDLDETDAASVAERVLALAHDMQSLAKPVAHAFGDVAMSHPLREVLLALARTYILDERPISGGDALVLQGQSRVRLVDSVAHFHVGNGAVPWRLNWGADTSVRGLRNSFGIMINYYYHLPSLRERAATYANVGVSLPSAFSETEEP